MITPDAMFERRLLRAYEAGRFARAAVGTLPLLALVALASSGCAARGSVYVCGAALVAAVVGLRWRGEQFGVGVRPGLVAGLGPLLLPAAGRLGLPLCGVAGCDLMPAVCAIGGLAGGIALGLVAPSPGAGRTTPFVVACLVAALTGAVGCLMYGLVGLAVMAGGLAMGALPILATRRA
jgi:hypothetical protein